jgi:hypothetical protein
MPNLAMPAKRQSASARIFSASPDAATRSAALFLLSGVEPVFEQTPPAPTPVGSEAPNEVASPAAPSQSTSGAAATRATRAQGSAQTLDNNASSYGDDVLFKPQLA